MIIADLCNQIIEAEQTYVQSVQNVNELRKELENLMDSNYKLRVQLEYALKLAKHYAKSLEPKMQENVLKNLKSAEDLL